MAQEPIAFPSNEDSSENPPSKPKIRKPRSQRIKPVKPLPSERISFSKQLDILRAYVAASGPTGKGVKIADVASIAKMAAPTISLVNPFFLDIGLMQFRNDVGFLPSPEVLSFARAHEWNPDTAAQKLAPLIEQAWFWQVLQPKISYDSYPEEDAIAELAQAASAGPDFRSQVRMLIEYVVSSGLAMRDNGFLKKASARAIPAQAASEPQEAPPSRNTISTTFSQPTEGVVQFHVSVKVDMAEFAGWKPERIAAFFNGIAQVLAAKGMVEKEASQDKN